MACSITITSLSGVGFPGGPATTVTVSGTAVDCTKVEIILGCGGGPAPFIGVVPVDAAGNWTGSFANTGCLCELGGTFPTAITVTARCQADPTCSTTFTGPLQCQPPGACPSVSVSAGVGPCNPDGSRNVTLVATITPPPGVTPVTEWDAGDGSGSLGAAVGGSNVRVHAYATPGTYTAILTTILPEGCPGVTVTFTVPDCPAAPCPELIGLTGTVTGCAGAGSVAVATFSGTLSPPTPGCQFHWDFGDGSAEVVTTTPSASHTYTAPGTYAVAVAVVCGSCISVATVSLEVPACCPVVNGIGVTVEGCAGSGSSATVTLVASTAPPAAPGTYTWDFGDGSSAVTTVPTIAHSYGTAGSKSVTVTYTPSAPPNCTLRPTSASTSVTVPACPGGGGGDGGEGFGCTGLRWAFVLLTVLSSLALFIALCVPGASSVFIGISIGLAIAAGVLLALWLIFCPQPCGWQLLLAWQVALGVGIGALYYATCCPILWAIGFGLIAVAIGLLLAWVRRCKKTFCQVMVELSVVITGVILPVLGWLFGIPLISACLNPIVAAAVGTLASAVAFAIAFCLKGELKS